MTPIDWAIRPLLNYANWTGRATRAEFWWFTLFSTILGIVFRIIDAVIGIPFIGNMGFVTLVGSLFLFIPSLMVTIRRLHDVNRTGRELIVPVIMLVCSPLVFMFGSFLGQIVQLGYAGLTLIMFGQLLLLLTRKGSIVPNRYGACPTALSFGR